MVTRSLLTCIDLSLQFTAISEIPNHGRKESSLYFLHNKHKYWNEMQLIWRVRVSSLFSELSTLQFDVSMTVHR